MKNMLLDALVDVNDLTTKSATFLSKVEDFAILYVPKLIGAVLVYIIGNWLINKLMVLLKKVLALRHFDPTLQSFLLSIAKVGLLILLFVSVAGIIGINMAGFAALLAGAGLAIGAALNGSLGNLAGGVMIMIFKPFKVGDIITSQGNTGKVTEIGIFNTVLLTADNKTIIMPNGPVSTNVIVNYNETGYLALPITIDVCASNDIDKVRKVVLDAVAEVDTVLKSPSPAMSISKIQGGAFTLAITLYCTQANTSGVPGKALEVIHRGFQANNISYPTTSISVKNA